MNVSSNNKDLERKIFTSFFRDGSIEAFTGIILLQLWLPLIFSRSGYGDLQSALIALPVALILLAGVLLLRKYIVVPRFGHIKFLPERKSSSYSKGSVSARKGFAYLWGGIPTCRPVWL